MTICYNFLAFSCNFIVQLPWVLKGNTKTFVSPHSGASKTLVKPGARWVAKLTIKDLRRDEIAELEAVMNDLEGSSGRIRLWNHARENLQATIVGAPLVDVAGQSGKFISLSGFVGTLSAGDFIEVGAKLYQVTSSVTAGSVLNPVTVAITPPLRSSPAVNSVVVTVRPKSVFMLADDGGAEFGYGRSLAGVTLTFEEDVYA